MATMSKISQFVLGFILAIALLFLAGAGLTRYMLTRLATPPPRPSFTNDPSPSPAAQAANPDASPAASLDPSLASPEPTVAASPSPSPSPVGYAARVTQPIGLRLRQEPNVDAATIGGIEYNQIVTVLEDSPDGNWQKVQVANGTQGWVKSGNTARAN